LLSPHPDVVLGSPLGEFIQQFGTADDTNVELSEIDQSIASDYGWRFPAQELIGFNSSLNLRDERAFRRPTASDQLPGDYPVAALLGYNDVAAPPSPTLPTASQDQVDNLRRRRPRPAPSTSALRARGQSGRGSVVHNELRPRRPR
jgi:hypothetical protein